MVTRQAKGGINFTVNGATVTQITSKSTGVTIAGLTGQITTHNATLNAAVEVAFSVTCRAVDSRDVVVVSMVSGGTAGSYLFAVSTIAVGSFTITIANVSGGNLSQAVVLNYVILKGAVRSLVLKDRRGQFNFTINGGAITQLTSKSTTVVINRLAGQITMDNADLTAGSEVSFTVTNSQVDLKDVVAVCMASGGTAAGYQFAVSAIAVGSFVITVANLSGGTLSQAIVLNYVVLKGVPRGTVHH